MHFLLEMNPLSHAENPELAAKFIPVAFLGMWLLVTFIISRVGWSSFAARYPAPSRPPGTAYNCPVMTFRGWARYNNGVRIIFTDAGVYFFPLVFIRLFHPPFLVPWASVKGLERKDGLFGRQVWLNIGDPAGKIRLRLSPSAESDLLRYRDATGLRLPGG